LKKTAEVSDMNEFESKEDCHHMGKGMMYMHLVHEAKMELIKEKVKKKLEAAEGKKLDELAELIVQAKMGMMKTKMQMMKNREEMMEKFSSIWENG
jgi:hypothetical protein